MDVLQRVSCVNYLIYIPAIADELYTELPFQADPHFTLSTKACHLPCVVYHCTNLPG
jgi:hypothetical protein